MSENKQSQVFIFHGEDDFSLLKKIERWKEEFAKKFSASGVIVIDGEGLSGLELLSRLEQASAPSLFAGKKLIICKECLPNKAGQEAIGEFIVQLAEKIDPNNFFVFYSTKKLDKRLGSIKNILKSQAQITEFSLPHGSTLNAWIKAYAKQLGAEIDESAIEKLAVYLGRDLYEEKKYGGKVVERKEAFNLWQAHSELTKLSSATQKINVQDVQSLALPKVSENIFDLADTIFKNNKPRALNLIENLFLDQSSDEKATAIKIVALLSEQVRGLLLVSLLQKHNLDSTQIADTLGWNSGRVFMVSKLASTIDRSKLKPMLSELLKIDLKLKSSDFNPKLAVDNFVVKFA